MNNSKLLYILFLFMIFGITSCQDEFEDIIDEQTEDSEVITADSEATNLLIQTSTFDGSFDNIVDESSCFALKFPYTVVMANQELEITSEADFELIEDVLDSFEEEEDILELIFPVVIVLPDYEEIEINTIDEFEAFQVECSEDVQDEDIECIDLVYPITISSFDTITEEARVYTVESDRDLRRLLANVSPNVRLQLQFPIILKIFSGEVIEVNSLGELVSTIKSNRNRCDEDDDNDYNDDDFEGEYEFFESALTECSWEVDKVKRFEEDFSDDLEGTLMKFEDDGTVKVQKVGESNIYEGLWTADRNDKGILLDINFEGLEVFSGSFQVYKVVEQKWSFFISDSDRIRVERNCEKEIEEFASTPILELEQILKTCNWVVDDFVVEVEDKSKLAFSFDFKEDFSLKIYTIEGFFEGTWEVGQDELDALVLNLNIPQLPDFNKTWYITTEIGEYMTFELPNAPIGMSIAKQCPEEELEELKDILGSDPWVVAEYVFRGDDLSQAYGNAAFVFQEDGILKIYGTENNDISEGQIFASGIWELYRANDGVIRLGMNLGRQNNFINFTNNYELKGLTENQFGVKHVNPDGTQEEIIFIPLGD